MTNENPWIGKKFFSVSASVQDSRTAIFSVTFLGSNASYEGWLQRPSHFLSVPYIAVNVYRG